MDNHEDGEGKLRTLKDEDEDNQNIGNSTEKHAELVLDSEKTW